MEAIVASMGLQVGGDAFGVSQVFQDNIRLGADLLVQLVMLHDAEVKAEVEKPGRRLSTCHICQGRG